MSCDPDTPLNQPPTRSPNSDHGERKTNGAADPTADSTADRFPTVGRLLGIDFGTKRVGIAVSNPDQTLALPVEVLTRGDAVFERRRFLKLAEEHSAKGIVVGLPVHMSGDEGSKARAARGFGEWLRELLNKPVRYWDERYTTAMANEALAASIHLSAKQKTARRDMLAAQILLQSYLDADDKTAPPRALTDEPTGTPSPEE